MAILTGWFDEFFSLFTPGRAPFNKWPLTPGMAVLLVASIILFAAGQYLEEACHAYVDQRLASVRLWFFIALAGGIFNSAALFHVFATASAPLWCWALLGFSFIAGLVEGNRLYHAP
ncbi:hypothetical protein ACFYY8_18595 [Streptosporangium sp. NPDC001559]|uniref:hypothetical protein n=1 Tax=Streptosporangium sp. NPDC001559 TaxID=3366187 RepID=UPI0036ED9ED9